MSFIVTTDEKGVKIFRKDKTTQSGVTFPTYSAMISSKGTDGEWVYGYIDVAFKKGVEVNNKAKIKINNSFYVCNKYKDKVYVKLMITDFDVIEDGETAPSIDANGFMTIPDDDIPEFEFV